MRSKFPRNTWAAQILRGLRVFLYLCRLTPHLIILGIEFLLSPKSPLKGSRIYMLKTAQRIGIVSAVALLASLSALAQTSTWNIDPAHSTAQFTVRHLGISNVTGNFTKVTGSVVLNEKDIAQSQVSASIDVSSVDTRVEARDKDLKSPNFFDVEKYPTMEFKSKRIASSGGKLQVIGDLTIHGTTREVTLDVDGPTPELTDPWGNSRRGISATTTINRKDFNLVYTNLLKTGEAVVGDNVKIQIDAEMVKKK
jgi:polyisoprenoid-binding protein YceI